MTEETPHPLTPQDCLIAMMVAVSASDATIRTSELINIQNAVNNLPILAPLGSTDQTRAARLHLAKNTQKSPRPAASRPI